MNKFLLILQIIIPCLLIVFILLQQRGTALGAAFGEAGGSYFKKRGMEKTIFWITVVLAVLFIGISLISLIL